MAPNNKVYVIDDDDAVRESLRLLLESADIDVEDFPSAEFFLAAYQGSDVTTSCVLADVRMPGMTGLELQRHLAGKVPELPVVIVTGHGDLSMAVDAMKNGAADFIEKPYAPDEIVRRVSDAMSSPLPKPTPRSNAKRAAAQIDLLTPRERDVFDLLVVGNSNKEVARNLGISPRTVEVHRAHIMEKTNTKGLSQLVRLALAIGTEFKDD